MKNFVDYSSGDSSYYKIPVVNCDTCKSEPFKYKCPKCLKLSCSLKCVKEHKTTDDCNGQKPPY